MSFLLEILRKRADSAAASIALDNGHHTLDNAEFSRAVMTLRERIVSLGCRSVAIAGDNSFSWIIADLALLGLPVRVVPLPGFFTAAQINHVIGQAQIDTILAPAATLETLKSHGISATSWLDSDNDIVAGRLGIASADVTAYEKVTFTSGSTGNAKGVRLSLHMLENTSRAIADALQPLAIKTHLGVLPFATLLENVAGLYAPLMQGVQIHVRRMDQLGLASPEQFNPFLLMNEIRQVAPEACILVPQLLLALVTMIERGIPAGNGFRFIAVGGGKVAQTMLEKARTLGLPVYEGYGLSECGSVVALNLPGAEHIGSVGKPLSHARVRVANDGEIMVGGAVMSGYLGDDSPSAAPLQEVATGDLGYFDEQGFLHVNGRKKSMFITAFGRNVNPEWVEAELMRYLPIRQVAVFGEAMPQNIAVIVARAGFSLADVEKAVADCNQQLPDYARIGQIILADAPFTPDNGLATANGRLRRADIETCFAARLQPNTLIMEKQHALF